MSKPLLSVTISLMSLSRSWAPFFTLMSASAASYDFFSRRCVWCFVLCLSLKNYLAQCIKDFVEVGENVTSCNFCDVVERFACIIPNSVVLIDETFQNRRNKFFNKLFCVLFGSFPFSNLTNATVRLQYWLKRFFFLPAQVQLQWQPKQSNHLFSSYLVMNPRSCAQDD